MAQNLTTGLNTLHDFLSLKFSNQARQLASHGNNLSRQMDQVVGDVTGLKEKIDRRRNRRPKNAEGSKNPDGSDASIDDDGLESEETNIDTMKVTEMLTRHKQQLLEHFDNQLEEKILENFLCNNDEALEKSTSKQEGFIAEQNLKLIEKLHELQTNIAHSGSKIDTRMNKFETEMLDLTEEMATCRMTTVNTTTDLYNLIKENQATLPEAVNRLFKQSSLATTEIFLNEVKKIGPGSDGPKSKSYHIQKLAPAAPLVNLDDTKFDLKFEAVSGKLENIAAKIERMDRNTEHNQGRLESRFDQLDHSNQRIYKSVTTTGNKLNEVIPEISTTIDSLKQTVWHMSHNMTKATNTTGETIIETVRQDRAEFGAGMEKYIKSRKHELSIKIDDLQQLYMTSFSFQKLQLQKAHTLLADIKNVTVNNENSERWQGLKTVFNCDIKIA